MRGHVFPSAIQHAHASVEHGTRKRVTNLANALVVAIAAYRLIDPASRIALCREQPSKVLEETFSRICGCNGRGDDRNGSVYASRMTKRRCRENCATDYTGSGNMSLFAPLYLYSLLPWSVAVVWLLWGRRRKTFVPFLDLWRGPALQKPPKRGLQRPPVYLAATILATLLALVAATRPHLPWRHGQKRNTITLIIDRGLTMSAFEHGEPRFKVQTTLRGRRDHTELARRFDG